MIQVEHETAASGASTDHRNLWRMDDEKNPSLLTASSQRDLQRNMYILLLVCSASSRTELYASDRRHGSQEVGDDPAQSRLGGNATAESGGHHTAAADRSQATATFDFEPHFESPDVRAEA